jgi:hypothetical protein
VIARRARPRWGHRIGVHDPRVHGNREPTIPRIASTSTAALRTMSGERSVGEPGSPPSPLPAMRATVHRLLNRRSDLPIWLRKFLPYGWSPSLFSPSCARREPRRQRPSGSSSTNSSPMASNASFQRSLRTGQGRRARQGGSDPGLRPGRRRRYSSEVKSGPGTRFIKLLTTHMGTMTCDRRLARTALRFFRAGATEIRHRRRRTRSYLHDLREKQKTVEELTRLREMRAGTTDPLATRLLQDIIMELEIGLELASQTGASDQARPAPPEPPPK